MMVTITIMLTYDRRQAVSTLYGCFTTLTPNGNQNGRTFKNMLFPPPFLRGFVQEVVGVEAGRRGGRRRRYPEEAKAISARRARVEGDKGVSTHDGTFDSETSICSAGKAFRLLNASTWTSAHLQQGIFLCVSDLCNPSKRQEDVMKAFTTVILFLFF